MVIKLIGIAYLLIGTLAANAVMAECAFSHRSQKDCYGSPNPTVEINGAHFAIKEWGGTRCEFIGVEDRSRWPRPVAYEYRKSPMKPVLGLINAKGELLFNPDYSIARMSDVKIGDTLIPLWSKGNCVIVASKSSFRQDAVAIEDIVLSTILSIRSYPSDCPGADTLTVRMYEADSNVASAVTAATQATRAPVTFIVGLTESGTKECYRAMRKSIPGPQLNLLKMDSLRFENKDSATMILFFGKDQRPVDISTRQIEIYFKPEFLLNQLNKIKSEYGVNVIDSMKLYFLSRVQYDEVYIGNLEYRLGLERICGDFGRGMMRYWISSSMTSTSVRRNADFLRKISYIQKVLLVPKNEEVPFRPEWRKLKP